MKKFLGNTRHWLILLFTAVTVFSSSTPAVQAQLAEPVPDWFAAGTIVDLSVSPAQVSYTVYAGKNGPLPNTATILKSQTVDISSTCVFYGTFGNPDANGYLAFDGATNYIKCDAPGIASIWSLLYPSKPLESHVFCNGGAPLFASADVKLSSGTRANPIMTAPYLGIAYNLPRNGSLAVSQLNIGTAFNSAPWTPKVSGNQLLTGGWNGPAIIAATGSFGWLTYLDPAWVPAFRTISGLSFRTWYQSPDSLTTMSAPTSYTLGTGAHALYIGHNPADNSYFKGSLRTAVFDPGCPAS